MPITGKLVRQLQEGLTDRVISASLALRERFNQKVSGNPFSSERSFISWAHDEVRHAMARLERDITDHIVNRVAESSEAIYTTFGKANLFFDSPDSEFLSCL